METKKVNVYKDSKGNLHEKYDDYVVAEYQIIESDFKDAIERYFEVFSHNPFSWIDFIKKLSDDLDSNPKERREKDYEWYNNLRKEYKRIQSDKSFKNYSDINLDNYNGVPGVNDCISATELLDINNIGYK